MFQQLLFLNLTNILYKTTLYAELIVLISILFTISSPYSNSIKTTAATTAPIYDHYELLTNTSYQNFVLRQHFIDLINNSHSQLIQFMTLSHHLTNTVKPSLYQNH